MKKKQVATIAGDMVLSTLARPIVQALRRRGQLHNICHLYQYQNLQD